MQALSVRRLRPAPYAPRQIEALLAHGRLEEALVADGTHFVAEAGGRPGRSSGWSLRMPAATSGVALCRQLGYRRTACFQLAFEDGTSLPVVHMRKQLTTLAAARQLVQG